MRKLWILACVLALPSVASAQWDNLNKLQAGQKIQVVEVGSKKDSGTFLSVSDKTISLQGKSGQQNIERQDVASIKLMENKHRLRNALIGGAVGAEREPALARRRGTPWIRWRQRNRSMFRRGDWLRGRRGSRGTVARHELVYRTKGP